MKNFILTLIASALLTGCGSKFDGEYSISAESGIKSLETTITIDGDLANVRAFNKDQKAIIVETSNDTTLLVLESNYNERQPEASAGSTLELNEAGDLVVNRDQVFKRVK